MMNRTFRFLFPLLCLLSLFLAPGCSRTSPSEPAVPAVTIQNPAAGAALTWDDDADKSAAGFQLAVKGSVSGFASLTGAQAVLQVDEDGTSVDATLDGTAFSFAPITLAEGFHSLKVTVSTDKEAVSAQAGVKIPDLPIGDMPAVTITSPSDLHRYTMTEDADVAADGFQMSVTGIVENLGTADSKPTLTFLIDGAAPAEAPEFSLEARGENAAEEHLELRIPSLTLPEGLHSLRIEASQGDKTAFTLVHFIIPSADDPSFGIAVSAPAHETVFNEADDMNDSAVGFQTDIRGKLVGFTDAAVLTLSRNGLDMADVPEIAADGTFIFHEVTLPAGRQVLGLKAEQIIAERLMSRSAFVVVTVPSSAGSIQAEITAPQDASILQWKDDLDETAEGFQLNISGTVRVRGEGQPALSLQIDGIATDYVAEMTLRMDDADESGMSTWDYSFLSVTIGEGIHSFTVLASQENGASALAIVSAALPAMNPEAPTASITSPAEGAAIPVSGTEGRISVHGDFTGEPTSIVLYVDGKPLDALPNIDDGTFTFSGIDLTAGSHSLQVQVSNGTYAGISPVVTIHLANFSVRIAWPADGETLFLGNDGQLSLSLLGSVQGCSQCTGTIKALWQLDGNDDGAEAHPLTLDEAGTFRENITISQADSITISVRAEQAISDTELEGEASEPSPAFQSEAAVSITVRDSSEKPPETITILSPADNSVLSWRDDADLSSDSLEISVTAALDGFQLDDAVFDVFVDSQLAASTSDRTCSLTTSGTAVTGLSCPLVTLEGSGFHVLRIVAERQVGPSISAHAVVYVSDEEVPHPPSTALLALIAPANGTFLVWKDDTSIVDGFQADVKCRFSGFSADAAFTLLIDGTEQAGALAEISGNVVTFRNVTLSTGSRRITVHGVETAGEKLLAATDTSIVTVPEPPSIQVSAEHSDETRSFVVTAGSANLGENAAYTLTAYAEGQSALEKTGLTAGELTKGISIDDRELPLSGECSSVFFVVTGTEGLAHASGISQLLSVGSGCGPNPPPTSAFVITSPANGQVIPVEGQSSAIVSVTGFIVSSSAGRLQRPIMGGIDCDTDASAQTFSCTGDFPVGENEAVVTTESGTPRASVTFTVSNTSGCPVTLHETGIQTDEEGRLIFNRNTSGLALTNDASGIKGAFTFTGRTPPECAGGKVTVLKKTTGGGYVGETRIINIQSDGTFSYRLNMLDGESDASVTFSAEKQGFAAASGAQLAYSADFTVPVLVIGEDDTFVPGSTETSNVYHAQDFREGIRAAVVPLDNGEGVQGSIDVTFTIRGLSVDPYSLDTLTISYDGASTPLLEESLQPQNQQAGGEESFKRTILIPEGDWQLTFTITDQSGNTSSNTFPVHVDLGCSVQMNSPSAGGMALLAAPANEAALLQISGTSSCGNVVYQTSTTADESEKPCQASDRSGRFTCELKLIVDALVTLHAPNGSTQSADVRLIQNDAEITVASPSLDESSSVIVVSAQNIHCPAGACQSGYAVDTDADDETGSFTLAAKADIDHSYDLSCELLLDDADSGIPCVISEGVVSQNVTLPQGTRGVLTLKITGEKPSVGTGGEAITAVWQTSLGVTIASRALSAPVFRIPESDIADCLENGNVTCIRNRHQGILDVWLNAPAEGLTRSRGYVTGTKVSLSSAGDNTEAFTAETFKEGTLMTWFTTASLGDGTEMQRLEVTPMNLIHLGARDTDAYGNQSEVAILKNVNMFWNHAKVTFSEVKTEVLQEIGEDAGFAFGRLSAVGDINGDGIDDAVVTGGNYTLLRGLMSVFYGSKQNGLAVVHSESRDTDFVSNLSVIDINHDGFDDVITVQFIQSPWSYPAKIYLGSAAGLNREALDVGMQYNNGYSFNGFVNARPVEDMNGDGFRDVAFVESRSGIFNPDTYPVQSDVFVVLTGTEFETALRQEGTNLSTMAAWQINGVESESLGLGTDLAVWNIFAIPDGANGPGLLVGAPGARKAYFFSHKTLEASCTVAVGGCEAQDAADQIISAPEAHDGSSFGRTIAVLDGNNDGLSDIFFGMPLLDASVTANQDNSIHVSWAASGDDGITFKEPRQFNVQRSALTKNFFAKHILAANLLGDGYASLIASTNSTVRNRSYIYWNSAAAGLSTDYGSIIEGPSGFGSTIETGDFNGDGRLDILFGATNAGNGSDADSNGEFHVYY